MRCTVCGKNNKEDAVICDNCNAILNAEEGKKIQLSNSTDGMSFLVILSFILVFLGVLFIAINLFRGVFDFAVLIYFINAAVLISIDSRLSRLEETNHLYKKNKAKRTDHDEV